MDLGTATAPAESIPSSSAVNTPTKLFVCAVIAGGTLALLHAAAAILTTPANGYAIVLGLLTIASGRFSIKIPGRSATVSFSEVFVFTSVILFGPGPATVTVAIDGLWMSLRQRDRRVHRALFNVAEPAVSTWIAGYVFFRVVAETTMAPGTPDLMARAAGTVAMSATYFLFNSTLTACAVALESRDSFARLWRQHAAFLAMNDYAAASLAALLVRNGSGVDLRAVGLVAPLLLLSYAAYKSSASRLDAAQDHLRDVEQLYAATVETLAIAVDAKDQVTHGHIRRVQRHTVSLARYLGMTDSIELKALAAAALLHDVGKLAVPDYVLNKPGRLTGPEFERIKEHASTGASILATVKFPYPVVPIVRHHHEQWNGRGYPDGLAGEAIPIGARILAVVDCCDALTSDRPYRRKLTDADAIAILLERRGVMYDVRVVDAFIELLPELRRADADAEQHRGHGDPGPASRDVTIPVDPHDEQVTTIALWSAGQAAAAVAATLVPGVQCCVLVSDRAGESLVPAYATHAVHDVLVAAPVRFGEALSGWVAANRHTIVNSHADLDLGDAAQGLGLTGCTSTPVFALGELVAVFSVYTPRPLSAAEARTVGRLGQEIGMQVARAAEASFGDAGAAAAVRAA